MSSTVNLNANPYVGRSLALAGKLLAVLLDAHDVLIKLHST